MDKYQNGWEDFYCPTCNCHSLGYYQNELCPVCGTKMQKIGYTITQDKNGGEYTVKVNIINSKQRKDEYCKQACSDCDLTLAECRRIKQWPE